MPVEDDIQALFGDALRGPPGVLHVTAVWDDPSSDAFTTLRIGPTSPQSDTDFFCLELARARCDAIVTTGRILREEPEVRHTLPTGLETWRREQRGLREPPVSVVLTGRSDLDWRHPLFAHSKRAIVVTSRPVAETLRESAPQGRVEVIGRERPSLRDTVDLLKRERGFASVCIEAGPSSSLSLYDSPGCVDELMLSVYCGQRLASEVAGGGFLSPARLEVGFAEQHRTAVQEPSGPWSFRRFVSRRG